MKIQTIKLYVILSVAIMGIIGTGCDKLSDFGDTNVNPNGSSYVSTSTLLSSSIIRLNNNNFGTVTGTSTPSADLLAPIIIQYFAEPTYPQAQLYSAASYEINASGAYSGILMDLQQIIIRNTDVDKKADAGNYGDNNSQIAIARILKALVYWELTDRWGDMPYSQALQGISNLNPKYDSQESIYKDMIKELTEAIAQFSGKNNVKGDLIYNGNEAQWKKVANSMRMLMALRLSKKYPNKTDYAGTEFSKAALDPAGYLTSNADNLQVYYPANANPYTNPWYGPANSNDNGVSKTYTDLMVGLSDPRINSHATSTTGIPYGLSTAAPINASYARILAPTYKQAAGTVVKISAASVMLAKAEGIVRGWIDSTSAGVGLPKAAYDAGVTLSFEQWNQVVPAAYLTTGPANYVSGAGVASIGGATVVGSNAVTSTPLQRVQLQQYIAYYPIGVQAWANWRRTSIPDLKPSFNTTTNAVYGPIPRRYKYGTFDYQLNNAQVTAAAGLIPGGDTKDSRVWWDQ